MKIAADLHIHSCASPCGDDDMTPNNIAGMAAVKGLEMIAVADHNTAANLPAVESCCRRYGVALVPALEVQTIEDVHILCYLPDLETAGQLDREVYSRLPDIPNNREIFGNQWILDEEDQKIGEIEKLLLQSTLMDIEELYDMVWEMGGICVPAHINRNANGMLYSLGFMPIKPKFSSVEIYRHGAAPELDTSQYHVLYSSDAHYLWDIFERDNFIELSMRSPQALIQKLRTRK
jgi:PHP family Zn ribbon phosphoesterase